MLADEVKLVVGVDTPATDTPWPPSRPGRARFWPRPRRSRARPAGPGRLPGRVARQGAVAARRQAICQLKALVVTAPEPLRARLRGLSAAPACAGPGPRRTPPRWRRWPPWPGAPWSSTPRRPPTSARSPARCVGSALSSWPSAGWARCAPPSRSSAGPVPGHLAGEAAFARLCGVAPIPASSGRWCAIASTEAATASSTGRGTRSCSVAARPARRPAPT
jgi:hypothetical protein